MSGAKEKREMRFEKGIYTLANDAVYDQLVALLNSIEHNVDKDTPVCVIPYDDRIERVNKEISNRENISIFKNRDSIEKWEKFFNYIWESHPAAKKKLKHGLQYAGGHIHRKFCSFDGDFEKFVFYDCDELAMKPLDDIFKKLDKYDFVFDDWEHKKPSLTVSLDFEYICQKKGIEEDKIRPLIHCDNFFGSKRGLFSVNDLAALEKSLIEDGDINFLRNHVWWDSATLFTYMTMWTKRPVFNFTQSPQAIDRTGNYIKGNPFVNIDNVLYNEEGNKPVHRVHYAGYPSYLFKYLSEGIEVGISHQDVFLYYRFMKNPEKMPKKLKSFYFRGKNIILLSKIMFMKIKDMF